MNLFDSLSVSGSALAAERQRSEIIAANMANAETTHTEAGGPYRRREVVFQPAGSSFRLALANTASSMGPAPGSVQISEVMDDPTPPIMRYEPGHPDANKDGYVALSGDQSGDGNGGPDEFSAFVPTECIGGGRRKADDPANRRHSEELGRSI